MDEEDKKPGTWQIPLLDDIVFDSSLPLKAPRRPAQPRRKVSYSPDYDPDTIDLFGDSVLPPTDEAVTEELRESASQMIDDLVDEFTAEIGQRLREELTDQLSSILEDLNHKQPPDP